MAGQLCSPTLLGKLALIAILSIPTSLFAETIVITDSRFPVKAVGNARIIELDRGRSIQREMSEGLPANYGLAEKEFKRRYGGRRGAAALEELRAAQQGVVDAWTLKIAKIPAIVIDRKFVVYGYTDVVLAEALVAAHLKQRGGDQ